MGLALKTKRSLATLVAFSLPIVMAQSVYADVCRSLYLDSQTQMTTDGVENFNSSMIRSLQVRSEKFQKQISSSGSTINLHTAIIGGGFHGSMAAATATKIGKSQGTAVFEAGDVISNIFGTMDGSFRINSPELQDRSTNIFLGSPVRMKMLTNAKFASSRAMSTLATSAAAVSHVPVLFKNHVKPQINLTSKDGIVLANFQTSAGISATAKKVVFATGLGEPFAPFKDAATQKLIEHYNDLSEANPAQLQKIMSADAFLRMVRIHGKNAKNHPSELIAATEGKRIAVIGQGDGGKIVQEALLNKSPFSQETGTKLFSDTLVSEWVGIDVTTPEAYRKSTWERYYDVAENIGKNVTCHPGHVQSFKELSDGTFQINYASGQTLIVDHIVISTGYKNVVPTFTFVHNGRVVDPSMVKIVPVNNGKTNVGAKVVIEGVEGAEIYVVGPAAGKLANEAELAQSHTKNPVSVEVLGPRTAALMTDIVKADQASALKPLQKSVGFEPSSFRSIVPAVTDLSFAKMQQPELKLLTLVELDFALNSFTTQVKSIKISVQKSGDQRVRIQVDGVAVSSARAVISALGANTRFVSAAKQLLAEGTELKIELRTENEKFLFEETQITLQ